MGLDDITVGTVAIGGLRVRRLGYGAMRVSGARNAAGARDRGEAIKIYRRAYVPRRPGDRDQGRLQTRED